MANLKQQLNVFDYFGFIAVFLIFLAIVLLVSFVILNFFCISKQDDPTVFERVNILSLFLSWLLRVKNLHLCKTVSMLFERKLNFSGVHGTTFIWGRMIWKCCKNWRKNAGKCAKGWNLHETKRTSLSSRSSSLCKELPLENQQFCPYSMHYCGCGSP